ncbi:hypothetical protein RHO12_11345 [Orbus sturtevantii]|uniref:hypothetical protein n=1 Tax=Orbus sturtevantii TaxID=3074109 RepID=UPI00370D732B
MMIEILDRFLYRSASFRYGAIAISSILLSLLTYYLLIIPCEQHYQDEVRNYHTLQDEITALDNKLNDYPNYQQLITNIATLESQHKNYRDYSTSQLIKIISQRILTSQLTLIDFTQQSEKLHFTIQGDYANFSQFIDQLSALNLNIAIIHMSVTRQAGNLACLLSLAYQHQQVKER